MPDWSPHSWQTYPYLQSVSYNDTAKLQTTLAQLGKLPPLVTPYEITELKALIAKAARGEMFILQGGDCAETFDACHPQQISRKLKILLQMSLVLLYKLKKPVLRIGRIAGQYSKPRSQEMETNDGITLPSYRGDMINGSPFTAIHRAPNPELLLKAYHCSASTLNFIRALLSSGFADLATLQEWDLDTHASSLQENKYHEIACEMQKILSIIHAIKSQYPLELSSFFASHEALHLHYEQALTRQHHDGKWYDLSTHLPWVGMRTGATDGAHIEFLRGIHNPIGIKIGPQASKEWLIDILEQLNPENEAGKILLISRIGKDRIETILPPLIEAVEAHKLNVAWSCDPMHGNTEITDEGIKTRHFDNILKELQLSFSIHRETNTCLGGVHFELTGDNVTECIGGARGLTSQDLKHAYHSLVDPRLNYEQSLEIAFELCQLHENNT